MKYIRDFESFKLRILHVELSGNIPLACHRHMYLYFMKYPLIFFYYFRFLSAIFPLTGTPLIATLVSGIAAAIAALFLNLQVLVEMMSIGKCCLFILNRVFTVHKKYWALIISALDTDNEKLSGLLIQNGIKWGTSDFWSWWVSMAKVDKSVLPREEIEYTTYNHIAFLLLRRICQEMKDECPRGSKLLVFRAQMIM